MRAHQLALGVVERPLLNVVLADAAGAEERGSRVGTVDLKSGAGKSAAIGTITSRVPRPSTFAGPSATARSSDLQAAPDNFGGHTLGPSSPGELSAPGYKDAVSSEIS